jgi:hypothetical protein
MRSGLVLFPILLISACLVPPRTAAQGATPPAVASDASANLLHGRAVADNARIRATDQGLLVIVPQAPGAVEQEIRLPQPLLERLARLSDRDFRALVVQRATHGGFIAAARLEDTRGVVAIAETIRDLPALTVPERLGIDLRPLPAGPRTFVFETQCQAAYNVPSEVIAGDQRTLVQPGGTDIVQVGAERYRFTLVRSLFIVSKPCEQTFEGATHQVDYILERE